MTGHTEYLIRWWDENGEERYSTQYGDSAKEAVECFLDALPEQKGRVIRVFRDVPTVEWRV